MDRHRHDSGLGPDNRLSSFDFGAVPNVSKALVMALSEGTETLLIRLRMTYCLDRPA
jgi:hypothetical protein